MFLLQIPKLSYSVKLARKNKLFKALCSNEGKQAIYCESDYGPCFGYNDICIQSDSNIKKDGYCDFGDSYKHPDYLKGITKAKNILAGSYFLLKSKFLL